MSARLYSVEQLEWSIVSGPAGDRPGMGSKAGKMWVMERSGRSWALGDDTADYESADSCSFLVGIQGVMNLRHGKRHTFGLVDLVVLKGGEGVSAARSRRSSISIWEVKIISQWASALRGLLPHHDPDGLPHSFGFCPKKKKGRGGWGQPERRQLSTTPHTHRHEG